MPPGSQLECLDSFHAFDSLGHAFEVEEWAEVSYLANNAGSPIRSVGKKHLRMAGSGNIVNPRVDGTLEDSVTGLRLRMDHWVGRNRQIEART
jgi:hypothetical protein